MDTQCNLWDSKKRRKVMARKLLIKANQWLTTTLPAAKVITEPVKNSSQIFKIAGIEMVILGRKKKRLRRELLQLECL